VKKRYQDGFVIVGVSMVIVYVAFLFLLFFLIDRSGRSKNQSRLVEDARSDFQKGFVFGRTEASNLVAKAETVEAYLGIIPSEQHVYYFPYAGKAFRRALEIFIRDKEELELVSMAGDSDGNDHGIHGSDVSRNAGYFVVFRKK